MARRKTIKRKISYHKSCFEAWPEDITGRLSELLESYAQRYKYVSFGITTDAKAQYDEHWEKDDIQWARMIMKYCTDDPMIASHLCKCLENRVISPDLVEAWVHNKVEFPESLFEARKPYYIYLLLGKRRKAIKEDDAIQLQEGQEYTIQQVLGWAIARCRRKCHMTQAAFAKRAGINANYLGQVEHGKSNVSIQILERISFALGMKLSDIIELVEKFRKGEK